MAAPIVCVLCALVLLKPQEFVPALAGLPVVHVLFALCLLVGVMDGVLEKLRVTIAPHVPLVIAFFAWGALVTFVRKPSAFPKEATDLLIVFCIFGAVAFLSGPAKGVRNVCTTFLLAAIFASVIAILQADGPLGCMMAAPDDWEGKDVLKYDGRPCEVAADCRKDPPVWNANYRCEHVGPFGTSTIGGRVRYRGTLADPNDLSLTAALALPFALALSERPSQPQNAMQQRRSSPSTFGWFVRVILVLVVIATIGTMIVLSQSRMGVLVFLVVLSMTLLRRAGVWGLVLGCILLPPMLLFGGRSGEDAEASSNERLDLIAEALSMIRESKGLGVGVGQFADESSVGLTAHNSYLLAAAETGIVGISLFALILYVALKIPITLWFGKYELGPIVRRLSPAIATSLAGAYVGMFFLSWTYKEVLYMLLGASAALYQAARAEDPSVRVTLSTREVAMVVVVALAFVPCVYIVVRVLG